MEQALIFEKTVAAFRRVFGKETTITPDTPARDLKGWDSLNHVILIRELEKEFAIEIDLFDALELTSVREIIRIIDEKLNL